MKAKQLRNTAIKILKEKWELVQSNTKEIVKSKNPGVYVIAWSEKDLSKEQVKWEDVYYIGMSNAKAGVQGRLKQFWNGVTKGTGHSAGNRWYKNNGKYELRKGNTFYYAYILIECNVHKEN